MHRAVSTAPLPDDDLTPLVDLLSGRRFVALRAPGCSTESGIPDYRGGGRPGPRNPIQHDAFMQARATCAGATGRARRSGGRAFSGARPNAAHRALAALEAAGRLAGVITQNVDRLHHARRQPPRRRAARRAGRRALPRAAARVEPRATTLQARLLAANPGWLGARRRASRPTATPICPTTRVAGFASSACRAAAACSSPTSSSSAAPWPSPTLTAAWALFAEARGAARRRLVADRVLGLPLRAARRTSRRCRWPSSTSARRAPTTRRREAVGARRRDPAATRRDAGSRRS